MNHVKHFKPEAIIFDKDGTLINFDTMWGGWTLHLAKLLHQASGLDVKNELCEAFGYDEGKNKVLANGKLASNTMSSLYELTINVMTANGFIDTKAREIVEQTWCIPDPVLLAKPFTDLPQLFSQLHNDGIKVAIATADNRDSTEAMVEALDIGWYAIICADDGVPSKPAPDMALSLCNQMGIDPSKVIVIGDTTSDLKMGRSAGAGLVIGVLSGVSSSKDLIEHADILIDSIDELYDLVLEFSNKPYQQTNNLNPGFAF